jgi:hypothetical protein
MAGISNQLDTERSTRAAIADHDRRIRKATDEDVIIGDGRRLIIRSPNGHFWNITVSDAGVIAATDMGTTL